MYSKFKEFKAFKKFKVVLGLFVFHATPLSFLLSPSIS